MFSSPFTANKAKNLINIPDDTQIVFVADLFVDDYIGGAELTSEALIKASPHRVFKLHSRDVNLETLERGHKLFWIFGNYAQLNVELMPTIIANLNYSILEYDYKYCKWRSPQKHEIVENKPCDDANSMHGKMISAFMYGAKSIWWMSEQQMEHYLKIFPFLEEKSNTVLSSVFDDETFVNIKLLREKYRNTQRNGWIVLGSNSWVKGADDAEQWCISNNKKYEVVWNLPYNNVLEKLATAEGFVYLPKGWDTCPRMVIEAKLLGCDLHINKNVQNYNESWFNTDDMELTESYLYAARGIFWNKITEDMAWRPTISGYTTTYNCNLHKYPWRQSIKSLLGFCDEVVVVDGGSYDETYDELCEWATREPRLKVVLNKKDWNNERFAVYDGEQKAYARAHCTSQFLWQQDADEVVHENDYDKIKTLCARFPQLVDIISLPVIEYWGCQEKVRMDVNPWKWRLSKNKDNITHGIPRQLRKIDDKGQIYSAVGSDGCDYIDNKTHEVLPHASFYNEQAHNARMAAINGDINAYNAYSKWFNEVVNNLPSVHHYSWYDLERKIKTYRDYWSRHWQSLYNIKQEDIPENNMFFNKSWCDVTDEDIKQLANDLRDKMGGWIFHSRVDFTKQTPHLTLSMTHPIVMLEGQ